jgi:hypothetical protein
MTDEHNHTPEEERRIREAALDETVAGSFPASDPASSLPNPDEHDAEGSGVAPRNNRAHRALLNAKTRTDEFPLSTLTLRRSWLHSALVVEIVFPRPCHCAPVSYSSPVTVASSRV